MRKRKRQLSEESDERLENEKSLSASPHWRLKSCPASKHWRLRKNWKVEIRNEENEFAGKCDATSGKQRQLLSQWKLGVSQSAHSNDALSFKTQNTATVWKTKVFRNQVGVSSGLSFILQTVDLCKSWYLQLHWGIRCDPISIVLLLCCWVHKKAATSFMISSEVTGLIVRTNFT